MTAQSIQMNYRAALFCNYIRTDHGWLSAVRSKWEKGESAQIPCNISEHIDQIATYLNTVILPEIARKTDDSCDAKKCLIKICREDAFRDLIDKYSSMYREHYGFDPGNYHEWLVCLSSCKRLL